MWTEEKFDELLTEPSEALIKDIAKIKGDIMVLGAGGKMEPTLCILRKVSCFFFKRYCKNIKKAL